MRKLKNKCRSDFYDHDTLCRLYKVSRLCEIFSKYEVFKGCNLKIGEITSYNEKTNVRYIITYGYYLQLKDKSITWRSSVSDFLIYFESKKDALYFLLTKIYKENF